MQKELLVTILPTLLITGLLAMNAHAHDGSDSGSHYVVDSSGNPVKSSSGCVTSSGSGSGSSEACGDAVMAKADSGTMAKADNSAMAKMAPVAAAPAPVMMKAAKPMGAAHTHPANHCTNSVLHTHAAPGGHSHHYSCKANKMASPRQMAAPHQKAHY